MGLDEILRHPIVIKTHIRKVMADCDLESFFFVEVVMDDLMKHRLRFLIMPTKFVPIKFEKDRNVAYELWKEVWDIAYKTELNVKDPLYSDNFSRQTHVAVLFNDKEPIILTTLNIFSLKYLMDLDDSYFKVWSPQSMESLKSEAGIIMTCGNLALNFKYRRGSLGVSAKDLIFYLLVKYLKYTSIDAMVATVRIAKGVEKAAYRTGAHPIMRDVPYTIPNCFVDLVCWHRNLNEQDIDPEIKKLANWIWLNKTEIIERQLNQGEGNAA